MVLDKGCQHLILLQGTIQARQVIPKFQCDCFNAVEGRRHGWIGRKGDMSVADSCIAAPSKASHHPHFGLCCHTMFSGIPVGNAPTQLSALTLTIEQQATGHARCQQVPKVDTLPGSAYKGDLSTTPCGVTHWHVLLAAMPFAWQAARPFPAPPTETATVSSPPIPGPSNRCLQGHCVFTHVQHCAALACQAEDLTQVPRVVPRFLPRQSRGAGLCAAPCKYMRIYVYLLQWQGCAGIKRRRRCGTVRPLGVVRCRAVTICGHTIGTW